MSAVNDLTGELQKAHFDINRLKADNDELDKACTERQLEIYRLKAEITNMERVHEAYHAEQDRLIAEIARLKAENERLREGLGDLMPYLAEDEELHILGTYRDAIEQARAALKGDS
jgi:chromosome segregation ATPase